MATNQITLKKYVENPKIGKTYYFIFAGTLMQGPIISLDHELSKQDGHKWFWMKEREGTYISKTKSTYPISIYKIFSDINDVNNVRKN